MTQNDQTFLHILGGALRGCRVSTDDLPADTDWDAVSRLAVQHKLLPMLLSALPLEDIPQMLARKGTVLRQVVSQTQRTSAFLSLYGEMEAAGFRPLVVKGILCRELYPQGDLRPSNDEDLYTSDEAFVDCCRFLEAQGFAPTSTDTEGAFEIGWRKDGLYIELHRRLFSPEAGAYGDLNRFFRAEGRVYPTGYGKDILSLTPHDHMLYLLLHAYKHFLHSGFGIRQVCDICLWAQKYREQIHWDLLARQCESCHARGFAAAVFGIGSWMLNISLPLPADWAVEKGYCQPLLDDILSGGIYGSADPDRQHSATVTLNAVAAERTGSRAGILHSLFPPRAGLEGRYPYLKKYPALLPLAWSQRILRYLKEKGHPTESLNVGRERLALLKHYGILR